MGDAVDDARGVVAVRDAVQHRHEERGDRLVEVYQALDLRALPYGVGVAHVRLYDGRVLVLLQQRPAVGEDYRVVVDVHDPGVGVDPLGDLMDVVLGRKARSVVDELLDAVVLGQYAHHAAQELTVVQGEDLGARNLLE